MGCTSAYQCFRDGERVIHFLQCSDTLQAIVDFVGTVVFLLLLNVADHPFQIARSETDHAVTNLPAETLRRTREGSVDLMRGAAFQFTDEGADHQRWRDAHGYVDVVFRASD